MNIMTQAAADGYACMAAWADLLDRINVFPVPDADTGTNLRISLAPLQRTDIALIDLPGHLVRSATGNSGNIAAAFLQDFLQEKHSNQLLRAAIAGRDRAYNAVLDPKNGTMLDVFDALADTLANRNQSKPLAATDFLPLCRQLEDTVHATNDRMQELKDAGVVDSGALGMFIFLEGFFRTLSGFQQPSPSISKRFKEKLSISPIWSAAPCTNHCIDALLKPEEHSKETFETLAALGDSVVISNDNNGLKIHLHTTDPDQVESYLTSMGELVTWKKEDMAEQTQQPLTKDEKPIHIMTDAAGSLDRKTATNNNITLLDSYIISGDQSRPESLCSTDEIYEHMRRESKVTTAQASTFERHNHYASAIQQHENVLYLSVGSVYTGNFATAQAWKQEHDHQNQFHLLDTGAASGRLGLITLLTARFADNTENTGEVIEYARQRCRDCLEYVFLDELKYLAAGGRISKTKSFFGDLLHMKPVISPMADGVKKAGITRNKSDQLQFAIDKLQAEACPAPVVLLQYSDNRQWLIEEVYTEINRLQPEAEIITMPLSLTSGVHMGPGTWAMAFEGGR